MCAKFANELRDFNSRLEFIGDIFSHLYSQEEIMASCIQHKLDRSFLAYLEALNYNLNILKVSYAEDPLKILKNMDGER